MCSERHRRLLVLLTVLSLTVALLPGCSDNDNPAKSAQPITVTDVDSNVYQTVTIGTQVWMAENLKVTHYRNGDPIAQVTDSAAWTNLSTEAYCNFDDDTASAAVYGRLYNWYAVIDSRNIAPEGWHVATDSEWQALIDYLGGDSAAGDKLKEAGTTHWASPNTGATNSSGFTALPAGARSVTGAFSLANIAATFWTSTQNSINDSFGYGLYANTVGIFRGAGGFRWGQSIRCVKD